MDYQKQETPLLTKVAKHVRTQMLAGVLVVVPLWLTFVALQFFFAKLDSIFHPIVERTFGSVFPGLGLVLLFVFLYLVGIITRNIVGRTLVNIGESILNRIPLVKNIYQSTKQLIQTVSMSRTMGFKEVVFFEYPRKGLKALGFVTNHIMDEEKNERYLTIFVPTTPNPTSGVFEIVPERDVIRPGITIEEGVKMVISGGMMLPEKIERADKTTQLS